MKSHLLKLKSCPFRVAVASFAVAAIAAPAVSSAHVTVSPPALATGSVATLAFAVPHGCAGSATRALTVSLPAELSDVQAVAKPGWNAEVKHPAGATTQVVWSGGTLPSALYDTFVVRARMPAQPLTLYFPVSQVCDHGRIDWQDLPVAGPQRPASATPAPSLQLFAKPAAADCDGCRASSPPSR